MKWAIFSLIIISSVLTFSIFLPFSLHIVDHLPNVIDPLFYAWNLSHNFRAISNGFINVLNTNIFYPEGNTLAFSDTLYAQTLFTAPILFFTKNPVLAENLYVFATFPMAAVSMFLLAYWMTQKIVPSMISGLFFAFSYPRLSQIGHMPALSSQWLPLFILFILSFLKTGKFKMLLTAFLFFLISTASSLYFGVFLVFVALVCLSIESLSWMKSKSYRVPLSIVKTTLIWSIPMLIAFIIVLYPYIRLKAEYPTIRRALEDTISLSATPADYLSVLPSSFISRLGFQAKTNEHPLYPTLTLLIFAGIGLMRGEKKYKKFTLVFLVLGSLSFLLSFGPYLNVNIGREATRITMPYYLLYKIFPLLQVIRVPARFSILFILSLSSLAAISLSSFVFKKHHYRLLWGVVALFLAEIWQFNISSVPIPIKQTIPQAYQWLEKQNNDAIIVELPFRPQRLGINMEDQLMRTYDELKDSDVYASESFRTYFSLYHKKRMLNGYSGYFPNVYHESAQNMHFFPSDASFSVIRDHTVRYIIIHAWQYTDRDFSDVIQNIQWYPQARLVQQFGEDYVYEIQKK